MISWKDAGTVPGLFERRVAQSGDRAAYTQFDPKLGEWRTFSWAETGNLVARWRAALASEGLERGDRVAMRLPNGTEWVAFDQAALSLGLVVVPIYMSSAPEECAYLLKDSGARLLLISSPTEWEALAAYRSDFPGLEHVVHVTSEAMGKAGVDGCGLLRSLDSWLPHEAQVRPSLVSDPNALATIVYTSGATGTPKGVMLSHRNILFAVQAVIDRVTARPGDVFLSFLPLAHILERTIGYYVPMMAGSRVAFARSVEALAEDLLTIRPSVFVAVPRLYERAYIAVHERARGSWIAGRLLAWTVQLGWRRHEAVRHRAPSLGILTQSAWLLLQILVGRRVLARFGGRVRVAVTGGAHIPEQVARFFVSLGLPLLQGYGLTEAAGPVSGNALDNNVVGSIGTPLPGIEVKVDERGEILVRSPSVMLGYWNQPGWTRQTIDTDGWLHTDDLGEARAGYLYFQGRLTEVMATSTGEKIAPDVLEASITVDPLIDEALIVGEGRPFVTAIVVLNELEWPRFAALHGVDPDASDGLSDGRIHKAVLERIARQLHAFPDFAQVRRVHLASKHWTVHDGGLTATMKPRRRILTERFAQAIGELYRGHELPEPPTEARPM